LFKTRTLNFNLENPNSKNTPLNPPLNSKIIALQKRVLVNKAKKLERDIWKQIHENPRNEWE